MTSSLPLLAAAPLVAGLLGVPTTGVTAIRQTAAESGQRIANAPVPLLTAKVATSGMPDVVEHTIAPTASERKRVLGYWTPRRMASALPVDRLSKAGGLLGRLFARAGRGVAPHRSPNGAAARTSGTRWTSGGMVERTTGRVFLTIKGSDFVYGDGTQTRDYIFVDDVVDGFARACGTKG
ncbi:NAD-dependent epimerase/dehydratase family protein, partial [Streptosporangium sp. NPDC001682]